MKIFITKYVFTTGIQLIEVDPGDCRGSLVMKGYKYYHTEGKDWHRTFESALKRANSMKISRIRSLEKSLQKIRELEFKDPSA